MAGVCVANGTSRGGDGHTFNAFDIAGCEGQYTLDPWPFGCLKRPPRNTVMGLALKIMKRRKGSLSFALA